MEEIKKTEYALGSQKIVRFFEHKGRKYVKIEDRVGWNENSAKLTFYLAKIAYKLFPENIPRPMAVVKGIKPNTFAIIAESIPHDEEHAYITRVRNANGGFTKGASKKELDKTNELYRNFFENSELGKLKGELSAAGLINGTKGGFEYHKCNVIIRDGRPVFVDFINPFYVSLENGRFYAKIDFERVFEYTKNKYANEPKRIESILFLMRKIFSLLPETEKKYFNFDFEIGKYVKLP